MELVAFVGKDSESWGQISGLINHGKWDKILLLQGKGSDEFPTDSNIIINVNSNQSLIDLKNEMLEKLKKELSGDFEVALSIASGNGKEHMALISSLLSIPVGIRLVAFTKNGVEYIN